MSWATPTDVTGAWLSDEEPPDTEKIQVWIDKAEREIRSQVDGIDDRIAAEAAASPEHPVLRPLVVDVVVEMVTRVLLNPNRQRSVSESVGTGPITEQRTVTAGGDNPGKLYLAADELAKLEADEDEDAGGAFEIDLLGSAFKGPNPWPW